jgi:hypothetical protein
MNNKERLQKLKALQITPGDGPIFKSSNDCMIWIDKVAPLLKYDETHYQEFLDHAQNVRITTLSAATIMPHLNSMLGIVNQAIFELENKIKAYWSPKAIKQIWHDSFWGKVLVSVVAGIILIFIGFAINKFIFSATTEQATTNEKLPQQGQESKTTGQDSTNKVKTPPKE